MDDNPETSGGRIEIEAKLRVDSLDEVRAKLRSVEAERQGSGVEWNLILDRPDGSLRAAGCGLRLRVFTPDSGDPQRVTLTYKGAVQPGKYKRRSELETRLGDAQVLADILLQLGFIPVLEYQKRRETWSHDSPR